MLQRQASSKPRLIWLALANAVLAGAVVGAALWLPNAGMLPGALGSPSQKPTEGRNVVVGRTTDATTAAAPTAVAASAPASAPATVTLPAAPLTAASAAASATPLSAASSATATVTAASAPVTTTPAPKAPAPIINTPTPAPTKPVAPAPVVDKPLQSKAAAASAPRVAAAAAPKVVASVPAVAVVPRPAARPVKAPESTAPVGKLPAATAKAPSSATKEETFHVNVGLFADENNARNAHTKLLDAGLASVSQEFSTAKGKRTRVRVGPFATRAEADTAADKIRALGLDAIVIQP
jgi:cell division protein FtsN